jgi:hypothetical protein
MRNYKIKISFGDHVKFDHAFILWDGGSSYYSCVQAPPQPKTQEPPPAQTQ